MNKSVSLTEKLVPPLVCGLTIFSLMRARDFGYLRASLVVIGFISCAAMVAAQIILSFFRNKI
jgi:hypothetical protein